MFTFLVALGGFCHFQSTRLAIGMIPECTAGILFHPLSVVAWKILFISSRQRSQSAMHCRGTHFDQTVLMDTYLCKMVDELPFDVSCLTQLQLLAFQNDCVDSSYVFWNNCMTAFKINKLFLYCLSINSKIVSIIYMQRICRSLNVKTHDTILLTNR